MHATMFAAKCEPCTGSCSAFACVPEPRPSGPPLAAQRRTIGVVARGMIAGLRPPRRRAGGLHRGVERCTGAFCREGCPV